MHRPTSSLLALLHFCRHSNRLIQSVLLAFVLSLGVAAATPAVQAAQLSPDQQMICVGTGGMKVITLAADGSVQDIQTTHSLDCPLCVALQALAPTSQSPLGLPDTPFQKIVHRHAAPCAPTAAQLPPARAPPQAS